MGRLTLNILLSFAQFEREVKVDTSHVARLLRLTLPAPNIVGAVLDGRDTDGTTSRLIAASTADWCAQREAVGRMRASHPHGYAWPSGEQRLQFARSRNVRLAPIVLKKSRPSPSDWQR